MATQYGGRIMAFAESEIWILAQSYGFSQTQFCEQVYSSVRWRWQYLSFRILVRLILYGLYNRLDIHMRRPRNSHLLFLEYPGATKLKVPVLSLQCQNSISRHICGAFFWPGTAGLSTNQAGPPPTP